MRLKGILWITKTVSYNVAIQNCFYNYISRLFKFFTSYETKTIIFTNVPRQNGIREIVDSKASRFSIDHLWQIVGEISHEAKMCFLEGMDRKGFIDTAIVSWNHLINEISLYGYAIIKLTHCTKSIYIGYDKKIYTTDGVLVALDTKDIL